MPQKLICTKFVLIVLERRTKNQIVWLSNEAENGKVGLLGRSKREQGWQGVVLAPCGSLVTTSVSLTEALLFLSSLHFDQLQAAISVNLHRYISTTLLHPAATSLPPRRYISIECELLSLWICNRQPWHVKLGALLHICADAWGEELVLGELVA